MLFSGKKQVHRLEESKDCAKYGDDDRKDSDPETLNNVEIAQYPNGDDGNGKQKRRYDNQRPARKSLAPLASCI